MERVTDDESMRVQYGLRITPLFRVTSISASSMNWFVDISYDKHLLGVLSLGLSETLARG